MFTSQTTRMISWTKQRNINLIQIFETETTVTSLPTAADTLLHVAYGLLYKHYNNVQKWHFDSWLSFLCLSIFKHNDNVLNCIDFVFPSVTCYNSEETMKPAGPLDQSRGLARSEPDAALEMLIMFVLFTNAAQNRFLISFFPLPCIYTHSLLFMLCSLSFGHKLQTKKHLVLSHKIFCLLEMSLRATAYAISPTVVCVKSIQMRVFSKISSYPKNRVMTWSLQRKSRWTFWD